MKEWLPVQFGSNPCDATYPLWLSFGDLNLEYEARAKPAYVELGTPFDGRSDSGGTRRWGLAGPSFRVRGTPAISACHNVRLEAGRHVGRKDYLIAYRHDGFDSGFYGSLCRLESLSSDSENLEAPNLELSFTAESPWERLRRLDWVFGGLVWSAQAPGAEISEARWPSSPPSVHCPFRFFRPHKDWIEEYCVGYWSSGRFVRAAIGSSFTLHVGGNFWPRSKLAFMNFSHLKVTIRSACGQNSFELPQAVGDPQYVLVSPWQVEVRYCPSVDDHCLDVPTSSEFAAIAQRGAPYPLTNASAPVPGRLWPGRNIVEVEGFRLPGRPFLVAWDIVERVV